jgi:hypothetical protein
MKSNPTLLHLGLLLPLAFALGACSATADGPAASAEPTAESIVSRHVQETRLAAMVAKTSSVHARGTVEITSFGLKGEMDIYSAKPNRFLLRSTMDGVGATEMGYDGEVAWMSNPMMGTSLLEGAELFALQMQADYRAQLMDPADYDVIELEGREEFASRDCHRLRLVYRAPDDPELAEETLKMRTTTNWFDVETGLMLGQRGTQSSAQGEMEVTTTLEEYGERADYLMPVVTTQKMMGMEVVVRVTDVEANGVDPSIFEPPDAVKALLDE